MVSGQSEWNSSSEANDLGITSTQVVIKKKHLIHLLLTNNSPLLEIEQKINEQNQLLLNNYTPQQTEACLGPYSLLHVYILRK